MIAIFKNFWRLNALPQDETFDDDDDDVADDQQMNLFVIMRTIKKCISFNRFETVHKINQEIMLRSLHRLFNPICRENRFWEYI